ncbi:MAG: TerB family tellurite resistance protein [Candidatus Marinimicrobia bacterium]|nr:TerB family tellurite resistance protein [Candidatus Neomarinimicrobiota bacterium]
MKKWAGTLIGGGLGFALLGPLGGIIGAYVGSMMSGDGSSARINGHPYGNAQAGYNRNYSAHNRRARGGDFAVAMLTLFAYVARADNKVKSSEVQYVKNYLVKQFGSNNAQDMMYLFKEILNQKYNIYDVTQQVRSNLDYNSNLEMLHILFGIAGADNNYSRDELKAIKEIANGLGINEKDYNSIRSMFIKKGSDLDQAYEILGISSDADDKAVKKAYHKMATKYHPDKVANLGSEIKEVAEKKFKAINKAYRKIQDARGLK